MWTPKEFGFLQILYHSGANSFKYVPESVIMEITGHSTREMFDRYNTVDEGLLVH